jgi:peptidoglycan/LPS O-acetylase OafA/YrhL
VILFVAAMSFSLNVIAAKSNLSACFYLPWNRLWELCSGGAVAYGEIATTARFNNLRSLVILRLRNRAVSARNAMGIVGMSLICCSVAFLNGQVAYPGWWALLPVSGTLLLIFAGTGGCINSIVLSRHWVTLVGLVSYPLYLWHWPLLSFGHVLFGEKLEPPIICVLVALAFILAIVTYRYIELPLRRLPITGGLLFGLCGALLGCLGVGMLIFSQIIPARSGSDDLSKFISSATEDWLPDHRAISGAKWVRWAHWTIAVDRLVTVGRSPRQAVFIGDSNMQQYLSEDCEDRRGTPDRSS